MLLVNMLLEWTDADGGKSVERLLYIDRRHDVAQIIRVDCNKGLNKPRPLGELEESMLSGQVRILEGDPYAGLHQSEDVIPPKHRQRRDRAMEIIRPIITASDGGVFYQAVRGPLVEAAGKNFGVRKKCIYEYLKRWMRGGMIRNALLPRFSNCGGGGKERKAGSRKRGRPRLSAALSGTPTGINIGQEERDKIQRGYRMYVLKERGKGGYPVKKAYELTLMRFFAVSKGLRNGVVTQILPPENELPSLGQFIYWGSKVADFKESLIRKRGQRAYDLRLRPILGDATALALGPGSLYQIDATIAHIWIVSALVRSRRLGRPVLYLVVDTFTHLIAGFYLCLQNASFLAASLALEHAFTDKVKYCADLGIEISTDEWPSQGLPEAIFADRGELEGHAADNLAKSLNIEVSNAPPWRADAKSIVERSFRTINDLIIHWQPRAVFKPTERGERDPRLEATLTLHELKLLVVHAILYHNRSLLSRYRLQDDMITDQVAPCPIDLWTWGIVNRTGHLRMMDSNIVRLHCLPGEKATVTARGIRFHGLFYSSDLALREHWFEQARSSGTWTTDVAFDPRAVNVIYLRAPGTRSVETCQLVEADHRFLGKTWAEVDDFMRSQKDLRDKRRTQDLQASANLQAQVQAIVKKATLEAASANDGLTKAAKMRGIRENRATERSLLAQASSFH